MNSSLRSQAAVTESDLYLLLSFVLFAMAVRPSHVANLVYVALGCLMLAISMVHETQPSNDQPYPTDRFGSITWLLAIAVAFSALADVRLPPLPNGPIAWYLISAAVILLVIALFWIQRGPGLPVPVFLVFAWISILSGLLVVIAVDASPDIDVWKLHHAANERLTNGMNPYEGLDVPGSIPDDASGATIDGYPYPPPTLLWFGLGAMAGDARVASAAAWMITLATLSWIVIRTGRGSLALVIGLLVLFVTQPGWLFVMDQAWTEPFTLMLFVATAALWSRWPRWSGLMLGLALVSKQYMIVLLPLLLLMPDPQKKRRLLMAGSVAAATLLPFLLWNSAALWDALVVFHLNTEPRPDASNLAGLSLWIGSDISPPVWLAVGLPAAMSGWLGHRGSTLSDSIISSAAVLASFFLLAAQAFANYWYLIGGMILLGLLFRIVNRSRDVGSASATPSP